MADVLTARQRSFNMSRIRATGNASTELALRDAFRAAGVTGWRRHLRLPGRPDFAFPRVRLAVFVHGCFWHGCSRCYRAPATRQTYWRAKVDGNRRRDRRARRDLTARGWSSVVVWEHELASDGRALRVVGRIVRAAARAASARLAPRRREEAAP